MTLPAEDRQRGSDAVQNAPQIDVHHRRPAVDVEVGCRPGEDVEATQFLNGGLNQPFDVSALCHIGGDSQRGAARAPNLVGQPAQSRRRDRCLRR